MANVSEQDYELLSAYVDGMLDEEERLALEERLHGDADLLRELTALYLTLAMVKQLPMMTAPRNFTLKDPPARWLIFPTTPVFTALSAAAATILMVIGFGLLLSSSMSNQAASAPPSDQEVALMSNTRTDDATGDTASQQPLPSSEQDDFDENQQNTQQTNVALLPPTQGLTLDNIQTTATALTMQFSTQSDESAATMALNTGGAGGGFYTTELPTFEGTMVSATMQDGEMTNPVAPITLSTSTSLPTSTQIGTMVFGTPSPNEESVSDTGMDTRQFSPTQTEEFSTFAEESTEEEAAANLAQAATESPTARPTITATPPPTVTLTPTLVPQTAPSSRSMPTLVAMALVLGGAVLFGIAFMTAMTRRGERRRARKEGQ
jgi:hypothetical protein